MGKLRKIVEKQSKWKHLQKQIYENIFRVTRIKKKTNYCRHDDEYLYADNDNNDDDDDDDNREDGWDWSQLKRQPADD